MKRCLLLALTLLLSNLCLAGGITAVDGYVSVMPPTRSQTMSGLAGAITLRNDTGVELKRVAVSIHILDSNGDRVTGLPSIEIPLWKAGTSETLRIYEQQYRGAVSVFKLSADINAQSPQGAQTYAVPAFDPPAVPKRTSPVGY